MRKARFSVLFAVICTVFIVSLLIGRYSLDPRELFSSEIGWNIFWNIRLPRILMAALLGMTLAMSGAVLQSAFKNPLASPEILGVSQGAAFGAAFAILFLSNSSTTIELSATAFALLALLVTYAISSAIGFGGQVLRLVLAGLAVSALFSGGVGFLKSIADPLNKLPALTFWLLGGLSGVVWKDLLYAMPLALGGIAVLLIIRWRINLLTLRDDVAISLGSDPGRFRPVVATIAVISTAAVTSVAGIIGWMGLLVPHAARKMFGTDNRTVIPASGMLGATLMIAFDDVARTVSAGEIPLGVVTSLIGAPLFMLLLMRRGNRNDGDKS
jgi:iron complex transport system permease protein